MFEGVKQVLLQWGEAAHCDPDKLLVFSFDASPYGVGAVLAEEDSRGSEALIAFTLLALGAAELNDAQLDRERLAVVFAVQDSRNFVTGCKLIFYVNHKPLIGILSSNKPVPQIPLPPMVHSCVRLSPYNYVLKYQQGKIHESADEINFGSFSSRRFTFVRRFPGAITNHIQP